MATREELLQALQTAHRSGDTANAQRLAQTLAQMDQAATPKPPMGVGGTALGVLDVLGSGMRGVINNSAQTLIAGPVGAVKAAFDPNMTMREGYAQGKEQQRLSQNQTILPNVEMTPQGQRVAQWIGNIPIGLPAAGGPNAGQVPRLGPTIGAIGDTVGGGIEWALGPEAREMARDAFSLATLKGGAPRPSTAAAAAVGRAQRAGYIVPPTTVLGNEVSAVERVRGAVTGTPPTGDAIYAGSVADRTARSWGGASDVDARIAMRNQQVTQARAAEAGRLPEMTPKAHAQSMANANSVYDQIKGLQGPNGPLYVPLSSQNFYQRVAGLAKTPGWNSAARLPDSVQKLQNEMLSVHPTVEGVVNRVRQLREDSFKNFDGDAEAQMLGRAQREAADILDDELRDRLQFIGANATDPNLRSIASRIFNEYTEARQQLSILHDLRYAMNPATGTIDASKIARLSQDGRRIAPQLEEIANAHQAFGGTGMQIAEKAGKAAGNPLGTGVDLASGAIIGSHAGQFAAGGTGNMWGAIIGALAVPFSRYAAREFALRSPTTRALTGGVNNFVLRPGVTMAAGSAQLPEGSQR